MIDDKRLNCVRNARSPFRICDILVFGAALVLTAVLLLTLYKSPGEQVEIIHDGKKIVRPLDEDRREVIEGKLTVVIQNKQVWVENSTCDKKTCEHTGKIRYKNQTIVCAQNRIVISIVGDDDLAGTVGRG